MATWFGKYNNTGVVSDSNGMGSSSDKTSKKKATTMFSIVKSQINNGLNVNTRNKSVNVNSNNVMVYANNHETLTEMKRGQSFVEQDCSNNSYFKQTYTQLLNPYPCDPQVVVPGVENTDCSNNYEGVILMDDCVVVDSSCDIYRYGGLKSVIDTSLTENTEEELILTKPIIRFVTKVYFGNFE